MRLFPKTLSIIASIVTIASFIFALLFLPQPYNLIGYIVAILTALLTVSYIFFHLGLNKRDGTTDIEIYNNRDEMLQRWPYRDIILEAGANLCVLGGTLREFVTEQHLRWLHDYLVSSGGNCKILIMNPASQGSFIRAVEENRLREIYSDLYQTLGALLNFQEECLPKDYKYRLEIRKYSPIPVSSMFLTHERTAYTFYQHERSSTNSLWYLISRQKENIHAIKKLQEHFTKIWDDAIPIEQIDNCVMIFEGLPGSGKTTAAVRLSKWMPDAELISSKDIRLKTGLMDIISESQRIIVYDILVGQLAEQICRGTRRLIIDGNLMLRAQRDRIFTLLRKMKIDIYYFHMVAKSEDLLFRIDEKCHSDPLYLNLKNSPKEILASVKKIEQELSQVEKELIGVMLEYDTSDSKIIFRTEDPVLKFHAEQVKTQFIAALNGTK